MLAKLSNIDKHRHLNLTVGRVWLHQEVNLSWGGANISFQTLNSGTEIERVMGPGGMSNAVKMKRPYSIFVAFDELTSVTDPGFASVANILTGCLDTVRDIVADFERFLK
jgi:hypothetical protein